MRIVIVLAATLAANSAWADCRILTSSNETAPIQSDTLYRVLTQEPGCAENVQQLTEVLEDAGLSSNAAMVANRGRNNTRLGSFSFFEQVLGRYGDAVLEPGDVFFGHFTWARNGVVNLDQSPRPGKLLIEAIAWDPAKGYYNFYELIGTRTSGQWFYRGDSRDAVLDNRYLHRAPPANRPKFGTRMRCSACHTSGGPIMKEIAPPHNDWWAAGRALPLAPNRPAPQVQRRLEQLVLAADFAESVRRGQDKLEQSTAWQQILSTRSLQEQLRPLFCTVEINLESAPEPSEACTNSLVTPAGFWTHPLLAAQDLTLSCRDYGNSLNRRGFRFPETQNRDADHPWLTPVKSRSDLSAVVSLVERGVVDEEFVADVLAVDFEQPVFSAERCNLLQFVPTGSGNMVEQLRATLRQRSEPGAQQLYQNLTDPERTARFHRARAAAYLAQTDARLSRPVGVETALDQLVAVRQAVFASEISKNPRGQILEPGFRVIFPVPR